MEASATIAVLRTDADVELAASVRGILEGIPKEQADEFSIKESRCNSAESLPDICRRARPDLSILIEPPERSFFAQLAAMGSRSACGRSPFLLLLSEELARDAPRLLRAGAADFVLSPIRAGDLIPRVLNLLRCRGSEEELVAHLRQVLGTRQIVGQSALFLMQLQKVVNDNY
jgi:DNA-binding response OmpR family regulator